MVLKAPFPYFGGKSRIADRVWEALAQPKHYIEPFFGSGAVLLARPSYNPAEHIETINDADGFVANVWRSLQAAPDEVARWCDWPVNHADLSARKQRMLREQEALLTNLVTDDGYYDPKLAGYWIWAASCWIGSGLTSIGQIPHLSDGGKGVHTLGQRPHLSAGGQGVHALGKIPHLGSGGEGVHALGQIPHLGSGGEGVHALGKRPHLSDGGRGVQEPYNTNIYAWFRALSERLRHVRVVCGDWTRVTGGDWQDNVGTVGIFFDPPYGEAAERDPAIYAVESQTVAADVARWALDRGQRPTYRIVLAGYYEEHNWLLDHGWQVERWMASSGYSALAGDSANSNRYREALFFSPHCVGGVQGTLF